MTDRPRRGPYPGLVPYRLDDAAFFFGRERARDTVIDNLVAYRLTVLYGLSGVGKSSLLNAGVVYALRTDERRRAEHVVVTCTAWSGDPLEQLTEAIAEVLAPEQAGELPRRSLADTIAAAADSLGVPLLVILDQFEEYFLYHPRDDRPARFDIELAHAIARRTTPANFLVSMREDALAGLDRFEDRIPDLLANLLRIDHLDRDAAREAIERPLAIWGELGEKGPGEAAPDLVEALLRELEAGRLDDVEAGAGPHAGGTPRIRTPYLQLVLARLWDEEVRAGSPALRLATFERLGGAKRIVATHLDAAMNTLARREQAVAAQVFRYLVTPSGMKIAQSGSDLAEYAELPESSVTPVLDRLTGEARILQAVGESRYEIYHDALARPILAWRRRWQLRRDRRRARLRMLATIALASSVLGLLAIFGTVGEPELATVDTRFAVRGQQDPPESVVVVAIDDAALEAEGGWPFSRRLHARLIGRLARDGAGVIAYNIQFTEASGNPGADSALIDAVRRAEGRGTDVVLATTEVTGSGRTLIFGGRAALEFSQGTPANANVSADSDGTVRRVAWKIDGVGTLAIVAAGLARDRPIARSEMPADPAWIDFAGDAGTVRTLSFSSVAEGRVPAEEVRGKVVVVGATARAAGLPAHVDIAVDAGLRAACQRDRHGTAGLSAAGHLGPRRHPTDPAAHPGPGAARAPVHTDPHRAAGGRGRGRLPRGGPARLRDGVDPPDRAPARRDLVRDAGGARPRRGAAPPLAAAELRLALLAER